MSSQPVDITNRTALYISDKDVYEITLDSRTIYVIDGKNMTGHRTAFVKSIDDIRTIRTYREISHYVDGDDKVKSVGDHRKELVTLCSRMDEDGDFDDLDEEYEYKKFSRRWRPVHAECIVKSEPLKFVVIETKYESESGYINSMYSTSEKFATYYRQSFSNHDVQEMA